MNLSQLSPAELAEGLRGPGINLCTGPFTTRIRSPIEYVAEGMALLYGNNRIAGPEEFVDFHVAIEAPGGIRRWWRRQALFTLDGTTPFAPLPYDEALPLLEWGLNRAVTSHAHTYLVLHAGVIERDGWVALLPGRPGAGKSTLCAYLMFNGWRLLSDELALVSLEDGLVTPLARPVSMKNQSIEVIRERVPEAQISRVSGNTVKGAVALLKVEAGSVARVAEQARPAWVIFPRFQPAAEAELAPRSKAQALLELGNNAFNYSVHGLRGFRCLADLVERCGCYDFTYSELEEAREIFARLAPPEAS
ncbi:MAG: HprK-related kinase A [Pseudomonadota bacterium]